MGTFINLLIVVWALLNLILFFKIWGMCNDVRKIRANIENKTQLERDITFDEKMKNQKEPLCIGDKVIIIKSKKETVVTAISDGKYECSSNNGNFYDGCYSRDELCKWG